MTTWGALTVTEPAFMTAIGARFDAHRHKMLATLRHDGAPRISGIETTVADGELWLAGMTEARKFADLRADPRFALHSGSADSDPDDPTVWDGDAKIAGVAVEVTDADALETYRANVPGVPPGPFELFRLDIREAVLVRVGDPADHLVIEHWHEGRGLERVRRT